MQTHITDEEQAAAQNVQELLLLAERTSGQLDDEAISAVAEATGASPEYVRAAAQFLPRKKKRSFAAQIRSGLLQVEPDTRRVVISSGVGAVAGLLSILAVRNMGTAGQQFFLTLELILLGLGVWNSAMSRDARQGAFAGAAGMGVYFIAQSLFAYVLAASIFLPAGVFPLYLILGAILGLLVQSVTRRFGKAFGIANPIEERQALLRQLVDLQAKLRHDEQSITFLSVDVVGSTQMKASADPLAIEFTFTEYHRYVQRVVEHFEGRIHSTAGDGVVAAFTSPSNAFSAAKNLQLGLIELNAHLQSAGTTISVRVGVHTGQVVTPQAGDIRSVNFAHVIDMASHIQKECPAGGVAISESSAKAILGGPAAVGTDSLEVHGEKVRIWTPKRAVSSALPEAGPPKFQAGS